MKILKTIAVLLLSTVMSSTVIAGNKKGGVYLFGISSSFSDTIAYVTPVQRLDSISVKSGSALPFGARYSSQLESFVESEMGNPNQTAATFYSSSRKRVLKDRDRVVNRYKKRFDHKIVVLSEDDFSYNYVSE